MGESWSERFDKEGSGRDRRSILGGEWPDRCGHRRGARGEARRRWGGSSPPTESSPRSCIAMTSPRPSPSSSSYSSYFYTYLIQILRGRRNNHQTRLLPASPHAHLPRITITMQSHFWNCALLASSSSYTSRCHIVNHDIKQTFLLSVLPFPLYNTRTLVDTIYDKSVTT